MEEKKICEQLLATSKHTKTIVFSLQSSMVYLDLNDIEEIAKGQVNYKLATYWKILNN